MEADFVDGDEDTVIMTIAISRYGQMRKPKPQPKPVPQPVPKVAKTFNKPPPRRIETPPVSKPPSRRPSKATPPPPPKPEPEPVPERDPDPYFVTEDYPVSIVSFRSRLCCYDSYAHRNCPLLDCLCSECRPGLYVAVGKAL